MHCVPSGPPTWNGPTNGNLKNTLLDSFTKLLVESLQNVNEEISTGNGWVTVHSLLTASGVPGTDPQTSWSPGVGEHFTGDTLACVLEYAATIER
eukprot:14771119-Heterocapsa_arctica.AAC.1